MNRPEIAQAIRDAALSWPIKYLGEIERHILATVFLCTLEWVSCTGQQSKFNPASHQSAFRLPAQR